jgi:cytidine deaminase
MRGVAPSLMMAGLGAAAAAVLIALLRARRRAQSALDDDAWIALCHEHRRRRVVRPSQSSFRVTAVVVYRVEGGAVRHVVGHNDEACNLLNSCCAERAAFLQLACIGDAALGARVLSVFLTSDAEVALTPGALCREYMLSMSRWTTADTRVVMEGTGGRGSRCERTLGSLFPFPSAYTRHGREAQLAAGERLSSCIGDASSVAARARGVEGVAWRGALSASRRDSRPDLHPVSFGACVAFDDGSTATAWQKKALEYGCSLDAVGQLCQAIDERRDRTVPSVLCMSDQHGVLHAPFGAARAIITEFGWGDMKVMVRLAPRPPAHSTRPELPSSTSPFFSPVDEDTCLIGRLLRGLLTRPSMRSNHVIELELRWDPSREKHRARASRPPPAPRRLRTPRRPPCADLSHALARPVLLSTRVRSCMTTMACSARSLRRISSPAFLHSA